jgi:hypothetical protein
MVYQVTARMWEEATGSRSNDPRGACFAASLVHNLGLAHLYH